MKNVRIISDFFTPEECKAEIEFADKAGYLKQNYGSHDRRRAFVDDAKRAKTIWDKLTLPSLEEFYKDLRPDPYEKLSEWKVCGLNDRLRYYKYEPGQLFTPHFDIRYRINDNLRTFLTFMIYLNDGFGGGETRFFDDPGVVTPKTGTAVIFPHELRHEGSVVTSGCKVVLRTDVMYSRDNCDRIGQRAVGA